MAFRRATLLFCITTIVLGVNFDLNSDGNRYQTEMTRLILSEKSPPEPLLHSVPISSLLEEALSERNRPMYRSHVLPKLAWHRRTVVTELFLGFEGAERERPFTSGGRLMLFSSSSTSTLSTVYPSMMALHDGTVRKSQFRGCSRSTHQTKKTNTLEDVRPCLYKEQEEVFAEMHNSSNRHEIEMSCLSTCSLNLEMSTPGQRYSTVNATDTICTLEPHHNTVENSIILPSGQCKDRLRNTSIPDLDSKDSDTDSHYFCKTTNRSLSKICRLVRGCFTESSTSKLKKDFSIASLVFTFAISKSKVRHRLKQTLTAMFNGTSVRQLIQTAMKGQNHINEKWKSNFEDNTPLWKALSTFTPPPPVYRVVAPATSFLPEMGSSGKDNMAHLGCRLASLAALPPSCNVSRTRLAQAGFYYDSSKATRDGNNAHGVVCFSCGIAVARWEAGDNPMVVHRRLKPDCAHILSQGPDVFPSDPAPSVHGSGPSSISSLSTFSTDSSLSSLSSMSSWSSTSSISSDSSQASSILGRAGSQEGAQSSGYRLENNLFTITSTF
ncbi:hypothetical protein BaRGS_00015705 [Batillaria attramentaria]|uniref:Uncharacterized protein n=1 Tax=Batillaria attramentaria TaxID=370345 RepID=A0ABD0L0R6_9CAEN